MAASDKTVVSATILKRVRNDLAKEAKKDGDRSLSNYLSKVITEHHSQLNLKETNK